MLTITACLVAYEIVLDESPRNGGGTFLGSSIPSMKYFSGDANGSGPTHSSMEKISNISLGS